MTLVVFILVHTFAYCRACSLVHSDTALKRSLNLTMFENRPISHITDQELKDLIGKQEENLWIDFKQQDYPEDPNDADKRKREICKDVTAMANAEGGYIIIGISEKNKIAQGFCPVPDAVNIAKSIKGICLQNIDPRIPNFEVEPCSLKWNNKDIDLVIIHIPQSGMRPHSFKWKNSTNFVKRYGDDTREFPISELIQDLLMRYQPPITTQMEAKLDTILRNMDVDRRNSMTLEDDPLEQFEAKDLLHLMKLRFDNDLSGQPYYRILAVPENLNPNVVNTKNEDIRRILFNPPNRRYGNFGVTGILEREVSFSLEGIRGPNVTGGEIIQLKNGYLEVRCPLNSGTFQWRREESGISTPWLYPFVVCEFPVSFLRLVKTIYETSGINSRISVQQEYHNLKGFMLPKGNPSNVIFAGFQDERNVYMEQKSIVSKRTVDSNFVPDHVAYKLVEEVYEAFGFEKKWIPAFDAEGNFILE